MRQRCRMIFRSESFVSAGACARSRRWAQTGHLGATEGFQAPGVSPAYLGERDGHSPAVGKKSHANGDVRSGGQAAETFLAWGEGYARLSRAVGVRASMRRRTRAPEHPGVSAPKRRFFRPVFVCFLA